MKYITLYLTFLITSNTSVNSLAQDKHIQNIDWSRGGKIPAADEQTQAIGLAGAISGADHHTLIIAGGTNFPGQMPWNGGKKKYYDDIFVYRKVGKHLFLIPSKEGLNLPFNLAYSAVCSTVHGIVIAGGENENGLSNKVFVLNWKNNKLHITYLPDLPNGLTNAALTAIGDVIYLSGGETVNGTTDQFLSLNVKQPGESWVKNTNLPLAVSHTVLLSGEEGKEIFLIGGRKANPGDTSTIYKNVFAFDVATQNWTAKESLPYPLSAACGVTRGKNLLIFSGDEGKTFHQAEKLIAEIGREEDLEKRTRLNQRKIELQSNHPGFSKKVLRYDVALNTWVMLEDLLPYGTVTTNAVVLDHELIIAGGEIKAGVRTPFILRGQLKTNK